MKLENYFSQKAYKRLFLFFIISINLFLTYFLWLAASILGKGIIYKMVPKFTYYCFNFSLFWPLFISLCYFVKVKIDVYKYYFILLIFEFIILIIYFVAYLYPILFTNHAIPV